MENEMADIRADITRFVERYGRVQALMRYVNATTLRWAYQEVMKGGNEGVGAEYGKNLDENLSNLLIRMKNFFYFPQSQDKFQMIGADKGSEEYMFWVFEDRMLLCLFKEILEAIYEPKLRRRMAELKKKNLAMGSGHRVIIAAAILKIDAARFLRKVNQGHLIDFLRQSIADKNFIKYCGRFLQSGAKLLANHTDSENESAVCFLSMMRSICECYVLQLLSSTMKEDFSGMMWMTYNDKYVKFMFEKSINCKQAYRQFCHKLQKTGLDLVKDQICFWEITSQKKHMIPHCKHLVGIKHSNRKLICRGKIRRDRERRKINEDFFRS